MEVTNLKQLSCVIWVPCITHALLGTDNIGGSNYFRISDYLLSHDSDGNAYELWAKVQFSNYANSEVLRRQESSDYNITLTIYKNTNKRCVRMLSVINKIQDYPLLKCYFKHLIKKVDKTKIHESELQQVATIDMICTHASHNGMLHYSYSTLNLESEFNVFTNDELPACVYHNIKALFHTHEFHDSESDAILTPYYPASRDQNIDDLLLSAIEHNLEEFQNMFSNKVLTLREYYNASVSTMRVMGIVGYSLIIICLALWINNIFSISAHIGWFQFGSIVLCIALILLSTDLILHWKFKFSDFLPKEALKIKGEYAYVLTLTSSKYIRDNENCRRLSHNINNLSNVSIHYVDSLISKGNNKMALISILLAVFIFLTQLLLTIAIDYNTTNLIKSLIQ